VLIGAGGAFLPLWSVEPGCVWRLLPDGRAWQSITTNMEVTSEMIVTRPEVIVKS